ncbi:MAG TPA: amino acid adenylation domain-containing protein, partial [Archangium sp.]|nr:amino acid adenylation domain-containing protein [Archangium sp.]
SSSFLQLLSHVRSLTLAAYSHQDLPFEKLVEELHPSRDLSRNPLFQVWFVLHRQGEVTTQKLPGLTFSPVEMDSGTARFDLVLALMESENGLDAQLGYNTDLFEPATAARMAEHFGTLLEGIVANPEQRLSELPLLTEAERHRMLREWNDTRADVPRVPGVHRLFERQVEHTPDAIAVEIGEQRLTYRELNHRANQLARTLRSRGIGPEVPVALCIDRSLEMVVGVLGIMKAGGAYIPMDPSLPQERLDFIAEDTWAVALVTEEKYEELLSRRIPYTILLDSEWDQVERHPGDNLDVDVEGENLAYVIYTSGSTGTPKGTLLTHRGLINTTLAAVASHGVKPDSRVLQFAAFGFDASVCEIFSTLLAGARLVLAPRDEIMPGAPLRGVLERHAITHVTLTPSVLAQLDADGLSALTTVISAGEACSPELVRRWRRDGRRFLNAYGPTEVTVCASVQDDVSPDRPTIGHPWPNVELYVLRGLEVVPAGVPGELCVGGVGLARGYFGRPELTAERFIPHPFSEEPGARLYRTGDLVRFLPDGDIEFLGRLDTQVKLRGFRIELGEIESRLAGHPDVRAATVVLREDIPGNPRLVAYVVGEPEALESSVLRTFLTGKLPEYMVPSAFVVLDVLPLNSSGKV